MIPMTPIGSAVTSTPTPGRTESILAPAIRTASPAKNLNICPARTTSPMPSASILPSSRDRSVPSSFLRDRICSPMRSSASARCWMPPLPHVTAASRAAAIASFVWSRSADAKSPIQSLVSDGLRSATTALPSTQLPPTRFLFTFDILIHFDHPSEDFPGSEPGLADADSRISLRDRPGVSASGSTRSSSIAGLPLAQARSNAPGNSSVRSTVSP